MAVNRGFVQLIPLTVYCWLERFASCEEDLSMPATCLSALPYIYLSEVQAVSLCPHAFFVFPFLCFQTPLRTVCFLPSFCKLCYCLIKRRTFLVPAAEFFPKPHMEEARSSRHWKKVSNLVDAYCLPSIDSISSLHQKWQKTSTPHQGSCSLLFYIMCFC